MSQISLRGITCRLYARHLNETSHQLASLTHKTYELTTIATQCLVLHNLHGWRYIINQHSAKWKRVLNAEQLRRKRKTNAQMINSSMRTANFPCNCPLPAISLKHLKSKGKCDISTCRVTLPWCNDSDRYRVNVDNVGHSYSKTPINRTVRGKGPLDWWAR